jgi:hypothetical protein
MKWVQLNKLSCLILFNFLLDGLLPAALTRIPTALPAAAAQAARAMAIPDTGELRAMAIPDTGELRQRPFQTQVS